MVDAINPKHYKSDSSGMECIEITEMLDFCRGNAVKYVWRAGDKDPDKTIEDLNKAVWYLKRYNPSVFKREDLLKHKLIKYQEGTDNKFRSEVIGCIVLGNVYRAIELIEQYILHNLSLKSTPS
jgi:hypothetical protein